MANDQKLVDAGLVTQGPKIYLPNRDKPDPVTGSVGGVTRGPKILMPEQALQLQSQNLPHTRRSGQGGQGWLPVKGMTPSQAESFIDAYRAGEVPFSDVSNEDLKSLWEIERTASKKKGVVRNVAEFTGGFFMGALEMGWSMLKGGVKTVGSFLPGGITPQEMAMSATEGLYRSIHDLTGTVGKMEYGGTAATDWIQEKMGLKDEEESFQNWRARLYYSRAMAEKDAEEGDSTLMADLDRFRNQMRARSEGDESASDLAGDVLSVIGGNILSLWDEERASRVVDESELSEVQKAVLKGTEYGMDEDISMVFEGLSPFDPTRFLAGPASRLLRIAGRSRAATRSIDALRAIPQRSLYYTGSGIESTAGGIRRALDAGADKLRNSSEKAFGERGVFDTLIIVPERMVGTLTLSLPEKAGRLMRELGEAGVGTVSARTVIDRLGKTEGASAIWNTGLARGASWGWRATAGIRDTGRAGAVIQLGMSLADAENWAEAGVIAGTGYAIGANANVYAGPSINRQAYMRRRSADIQRFADNLGKIDPTMWENMGVATVDAAVARAEENAVAETAAVAKALEIELTAEEKPSMSPAEQAVELFKRVTKSIASMDTETANKFIAANEGVGRSSYIFSGLVDLQDKVRSDPKYEEQVRLATAGEILDQTDILGRLNKQGMSGIQLRVVTSEAGRAELNTVLYNIAMERAEARVEQKINDGTERGQATEEVNAEISTEVGETVDSYVSNDGFSKVFKIDGKEVPMVYVFSDNVMASSRTVGQVLSHEVVHAMEDTVQGRKVLDKAFDGYFERYVVDASTGDLQTDDAGNPIKTKDGKLSRDDLKKRFLRYSSLMGARQGQFLLRFAKTDAKVEGPTEITVENFDEHLGESAIRYTKGEVMSEIARGTYLASRARDIISGNQTGALPMSYYDDSMMQRVIDNRILRRNTLVNRTLSNILMGLNRNRSGQRTILGDEIGPLEVALYRKLRRNLKNEKGFLIARTESDRKGEGEIPATPVMDIIQDEALVNYFANADIFARDVYEQVRGENDDVISERKIDPDTAMNMPNESGVRSDGTKVYVITKLRRDPAGRPLLLTKRELNRRAKDRNNLIRNAILTAKIDKGQYRMREEGTQLRGILSQSQIEAIKNIPEVLLPARMKRYITDLNEKMAEQDGGRILIEYQSAMDEKGRYRSLSANIRDEVPIGFFMSKAGNFLITTISVSRMYDKMSKWAAEGRLNLWDGDVSLMYGDVLKYLENHKAGLQGITGLDSDSQIAERKKNIINDLFNVYDKITRLNNPDRVSKRGGKDGLIRSRRIDRITFLMSSSGDKMPISYGLLKENYLPTGQVAEGDPVDAKFMSAMESAKTLEEFRQAMLAAVEEGKREGVWENFTKWFGDSRATHNRKPISEGGIPLVLYHGSSDASFSEFLKRNQISAKGFFFTDTRREAEAYGRFNDGGRDISFVDVDGVMDEARKTFAFSLYQNDESGASEFVDRLDIVSPEIPTREEILKQFEAAGWNSEEGERIQLDGIILSPDYNEYRGKVLYHIDRGDLGIDISDTDSISNELQGALDELRYQIRESETEPVDGSVYPVFLRTNLVTEIDAKGSYWDEIVQDGDEFIEKMREEDPDFKPYQSTTNEIVNQTFQHTDDDTVLFRNVIDSVPVALDSPHNVWVVKEPNQIKYLYNEGTFDAKTDDIRFLPTMESGVQQWSRGEFFPATIVGQGLTGSYVMYATYGALRGPNHEVSELGRDGAYKAAEDDARRAKSGDLQGFEEMSDGFDLTGSAYVDDLYMSALDSGDIEAADSLLNEEALRRGWERVSIPKNGTTEIIPQTPVTGLHVAVESQVSPESDVSGAQPSRSAYIMKKNAIGWEEAVSMIADGRHEDGFPTGYDTVVFSEGGPVEYYAVRDASQLRTANPVIYGSDGRIQKPSERLASSLADVRYLPMDDGVAIFELATPETRRLIGHDVAARLQSIEDRAMDAIRDELGLGYEAGPSDMITAVGNVDPDTADRVMALSRSAKALIAEYAIPSTMDSKGDVILGVQEDGVDSEYVRSEFNKRSSEFFTKVTEGETVKYRPDIANYKPVINLKENENVFVSKRREYVGHFDNHIMTSIPGFYEMQAAVGLGLIRALMTDAKDKYVLDIGASEGSFLKTLSNMSGGQIRGVALDPNQAMKNTFETKPQMAGVEFLMDAFAEPKYQGKTLWTEPNQYGDGDVEIKGYKPKRKFDVVHEAMTFQFINADRAGQIAAAKDMMTDDGIMILEQKVQRENKEVEQAAEDMNDRLFRSQFYNSTQMSAKEKDILRREQKEGEEKALGMKDQQAEKGQLEAVLSDNFDYVVQFWSAGNFVGYVASNNEMSVRDFLGMPFMRTHNEYAVESTPVSFGRERMGLNPTSDLGLTTLEHGIAISKGENFKTEFADSTLTMDGTSVSNRGVPKVLYHITDREFSKFDPYRSDGGIHLGTVAQVDWLNRNKGWTSPQSLRTIPLVVNAKNIIDTEDMGTWGPHGVVELLYKRLPRDSRTQLYILLEQLDRILDEQTTEKGRIKEGVRFIRKLAKLAKVDAISYLNRFEVDANNIKTVPGNETEPDFLERTENETDQEFLERAPQAEKSYLVFEPSKIRSVWREEYGDPTDAAFMPLSGNIGIEAAEKATIDDLTPERIHRLARLGGWLVVKAQNPQSQDASLEVNAELHRKLLADLEAEADPDTIIEEEDGRYKGLERGVVLINPNFTYTDAVELAKKYNQPNVLTADGLVYPDGSIEPATGGIEPHQTPPNDFYTSILSTGAMFTLGLHEGVRSFDDHFGVQPNFMPQDYVHYSAQKNLSVIDPKYHGTGIKWAEGAEGARKIAYPELYRDRSYIGLDGYEKEGDLPDAMYRGSFDDGLIYDIVKDSDGIVKSVKKGFEEGRYPFARFDSAARIITWENEIVDAGYAGYSSGPVAAIFKKFPTGVKVTKESIKKLEDGGGDTASFMPSTQSSVNDHLRVSVTFKKADPDDNVTGRQVDYSGVSAEIKKRVAEKLMSQKSEEGWGALPDGYSRLRNPEKRIELMIDFLKENLVALYQTLPDEYTSRAKLWYDGANRVAWTLAERYDIGVEQAAGVMATLSPQKDWFMNQAMAEQVADINAKYMDKKVIRKEYDEKIEDIISRSSTPAGKLKGKSKVEKERITQESRDKRRLEFDLVEGKSVRELLADGNPVLIGLALRVIAETEYGTAYTVTGPEANPMGVAISNKGAVKVIIWQEGSAITKALRILENGSLENISTNLGMGHKVRSFYNNIVSPNSLFNDVTVDTHAVGASRLMSIGSTYDVVTTAMSGMGGAPKDGYRSMYWMYQEAYRRAAESVDILPRQLQSVVWEAIRLNDNVVDKHEYIWRENDEQTARAILTGQRIHRPFWLGGAEGGEFAGGTRVLQVDPRGRDGSGGSLLFAGGARESLPIRGVESDAGKFMPAQDLVQGFYSRMERAVDSAEFGQTKPKSAKHWIGVLEKWAQGRMSAGGSLWSQGIAQEEFKWSGIAEWLEKRGKSGPITKDEVLAYLRGEGAVRFEEVVLGRKPWKVSDLIYTEYFETEAEAETAAIEWQDNAMDGEDRRDIVLVGDGWSISLEHPDFEFSDEKKWVLYNNLNEPTQYFDEESDAAAALDELNSEYAIKPLFEDYWQSDSGETYGSIEEAETARDLEDVELTGVEVSKTDEADDSDSGTQHHKWQLEGGEKYREIIVTMPTKTESGRRKDRDMEYTSDHFPDIKNYVAHFRVNVRVDDTGKRILFIEEVQSDLHQAGRKEGYAVEEQEYVIKVNPSRGIWDVLDHNGDRLGGYLSHEEAQSAVDRFKKIDPGVPDAPFRKTWPLQLFKRALRMAVAENLDGIGWTNGDTQAERYDLSKQVDSITINRHTEDGGGFQFSAEKNGQNVIRLQDAKDETELAGIVGKDLARKAAELGATEEKTFSGIDLKVGGKGMSAFYDKMLVSEVKKYVSKWGAQVEKGTVPIEIGKPTAEINEVSMTDAMREGVEAGQPLFMPSGDTNSEAFKTWNDDSKDGWKQRLSDAYDGLTGLDITKAVLDSEVFPGEERPSRISSVSFSMKPTEYRGQHGAPDSESGSPANDLTDTYPDDIYTSKGAQYYGHFGGNDPMDVESIHIIQSLKGRPNASVKIYRAVPNANKDADKVRKSLNDTLNYYFKWNFFKDGDANVEAIEEKYPFDEYGYDGQKEAILTDLRGQSVEADAALKPALKMNDGDWVTISRAYAKDHGESALHGSYKIISKTVKAKHIYTNGDSIHEWGYDTRVPQATFSMKPMDAAPDLSDLDELDSESGGDEAGQPLFMPSANTNSEAFKTWFGDSKVVDRNGEPLVVYHGTTKDFEAFDNSKTGSNDAGLWGKGHYFSANPRGPNNYATRQGDGARIIPAYVSIKNPLVLTRGDDRITRMPDGTNSKDLVGPNLNGAKIKEIALAGGHDGVIQINPDGGIGDLVAYEPTQIKSAIGNRGTYDPNDPDIRFMPAGDTNSEAFKTWFDDAKVVDAEGKPLVVYHGSRVGGLSEFKKSSAGSGVTGSNSSGGFYFSSSEDAAAWFADPVEITKESDQELSEDDIQVYGDEGEFFILVGDINTGSFETEDAAHRAGVDIVEKWNESEIGDVVFEDKRVMPVFLSIKNPLRVESMTEFRAAELTAREDGYDGIIAEDVADGAEVSTVYVAFEPTQIKSATGNRGTYDPNDPDIRFMPAQTFSILLTESMKASAKKLSHAMTPMNVMGSNLFGQEGGSVYPVSKDKVYDWRLGPKTIKQLRNRGFEAVYYYPDYGFSGMEQMLPLGQMESSEEKLTPSRRMLILETGDIDEKAEKEEEVPEKRFTLSEMRQMTSKSEDELESEPATVDEEPQRMSLSELRKRARSGNAV